VKTFKEIGQSVTDKITQHRYDRFYPMFLEPLRNQEFSMLEIGIDRGGSLSLWKEYFPYAKIFGADIHQEWKDERTTVIKCDQSSAFDLKILAQKVPKCKLIIDDGSHNPQHQMITFCELFKNALDFGGVYIIEDLECNYWHPDSSLYGYQVGHFNFIDFLKKLADEVNEEFSKRKNYFSISSVTFGHNCAIIKKQTEDEILISSRNYRFADKL
jgi:hypothetical protein